MTDPEGVVPDTVMVPAAPVPPPLPGVNVTVCVPATQGLAPDAYCGPLETPEPVTSCEAAMMPFWSTLITLTIPVVPA